MQPLPPHYHMDMKQLMAGGGVIVTALGPNYFE